jgi:hypothetical protein
MCCLALLAPLGLWKLVEIACWLLMRATINQ